MNIEEDLKGLDVLHITILFWKMMGENHEQIGARFRRSEGWVDARMSEIYLALGFDPDEHSSVKAKRLKDEYLPVVEKITGKNPDTLIDWPKRAKPLEQVRPQVETTKPDLDQKPQETPPSSPTPRSGRRWNRTLIVIPVLLLCAGIAFVVWWFSPLIYPHFYPATPTAIDLNAAIGTALAMTQAAPQTTPATATGVSVETPTDMIFETPLALVTATEVATDTPLPTTPTTTEFVPPPDGILFQDDFENGKLDKWNRYTGSWVITEGKLSKLTENPYNSSYDWIGIPQPPAKNYIVSLDITELRSNSYPPIAIVVRQNVAEAKYIGAQIDFYPWIYLSLISNDSQSRTEIAGHNQNFIFPTGTEVNVQLEVNDDNYILRVNGQQLQSVSITGYDSPEIRIGLHCSDYPGCPTFDNFKVTYLP